MANVRARQVIHDNIASMFGSIKKANGYLTDGGLYVDHYLLDPDERPGDQFPAIVFQLGSERVEFFAAKQRQSAISATVFGVVSADQTDDLICELNDLVDDMIAAILTDQKLGGSVDMTDELDFQTVAMETFGIAETTLTYRFERNGENGVANVARTWRIENVAAGTYTFGNGVFATVPNNLTNAPYVEVQELTDSVGYPDAITATGFELVDQGTGSEALSALVTVREKLL